MSAELLNKENATKGQLKRFDDELKSGKLLYAYISVGGYLVTHVIYGVSYFAKQIYGTRGGWNNTECYKSYDQEEHAFSKLVFKN